MTKCFLCHFDRVNRRLHVISTEQSVLFVISTEQSVLFVISTEAAGVMEKSGFDAVGAVRRLDPSASLGMTKGTSLGLGCDIGRDDKKRIQFIFGNLG